jgi:hypothetical protein
MRDSELAGHIELESAVEIGVTAGLRGFEIRA